MTSATEKPKAMREIKSRRDRRHSPMDYDAELRVLNQVLRRAYALRRDDDVVDIGCGTGQTTREAARKAPDGSSVGVDNSAEMVDGARELTEAVGPHNATFVHADVQNHSFSSESFDVAISRFGTMFFRDPVSAFANIAHALCPGGRLVMMVWQAHERNEWSVAIADALAGDKEFLPPAAQESDPFSLADPDTVIRILGAAGFTDVTFTDVREPVYYGPDVATALRWVRGFACTSDVMRSLDSASAEHILERLRETLAAHTGAEGIWFDSQAWIVRARRA
jgi:ubiquinone/menaquinone biosynthesis C-methylase UbiE